MTKYLLFFSVLSAMLGCGHTPQSSNCSDSCKNLVNDAVSHYDRYDYNYVIQLPDNNECCDNSTLKSILWWKALSYLELKQFELSIQNFSRLIQLDSGFAEAYGKRGLAYDFMGVNSAALADYNKALELNPDLHLERNNRAGIYRRQGELVSAEKDYTYIITKDSTFFQAYYNRGLIYASQEKYLNAIVDFRKALSIDTLDQLLMSLSTVELKANLPNDALAHIELAISLYPNNPELYLNRAYVNMALNNVDGACEDIQRLDRMGFESEDPKLNEPCEQTKKLDNHL